jgi:hypothetical protein
MIYDPLYSFRLVQIPEAGLRSVIAVERQQRFLLLYFALFVSFIGERPEIHDCAPGEPLS